MLESLLLGDDGLGLWDAVGELEGREVAVVAGPADEGAGKASCCGPAGQPVVDVVLSAGRGGVASFPEVVEECEGDRCRLFRGEEGALLQLAAGGEVVHAVEVDPACKLFDQPPVVRVNISEFACQPVLEPFDIEVDGLEELVLDAELSEERDLAGLAVPGERGVLEGDDSLGELADEGGGVC